ncbi:MAG: PilZ domain-containing protein [Pseudomonadota bacterium]
MAKQRTKPKAGTAAGAVSSGADKRKDRRESASVELVVRGSNQEFSAQTVDISRMGALLWITDENFVAPDQAANMVVFSEAVATELGDAMAVSFLGGAVERECDSN